ncbi:MAG: type II toxin-antitoxin system HicA family toxin [Candidatus Absconditabacteria bacterium]|nr:type II toxin-antitoxin system HicA family toxin [Candidatus Absconditabacteria bacterium]
MPKLSPISSKKLIKILLSLGYNEIRIKGSHHFFSDSKGKTTVVPVHGNEDIGIGLLKKILRDVNLSTDEFDILRNK